jgi:hypothetical protein
MNQDFRDLLAEFNAHSVEYIDGVTFDDAWPARLPAPFADQVAPVLSREDLIRNKRASGRPRDLVDAMWLETHGSEK